MLYFLLYIKQKKEKLPPLIETQFIDGITNDALRAAVRMAIKEQSKGFWKLGVKSVLETAVELSEIYAKETIDINEV